jgi:orotate phosphoribosyltransferase
MTPAYGPTVTGHLFVIDWYSVLVSGVLPIFEQTGAYLKGHFRLTSGLHSDEYLQCALVLQHPVLAEQFGRDLAAQLGPADIVMSPAIGGLIIGHEVARALGARFIFTERDAGKMSLRRGFSLEIGQRVVVVEDVITTGGSTREVIDLARAAGAEVTRAGSIIDRSGGSADLGVTRVALATLQVRTWKPEECPLCQQGLPVVKPGSRTV